MKCASCSAEVSGEMCAYCGSATTQASLAPAAVGLALASFAASFSHALERAEWLEMLERDGPARLTWRLHEATGQSLSEADAALESVYESFDLHVLWLAAKRSPANLQEIRRREEFLAFQRSMSKR